MVGTQSILVESRIIKTVFQIFDRLGLKVYIHYNNKKLLTGIMQHLGVENNLINEVLLCLSKIDKIGADGVKEGLLIKGMTEGMILKLFHFIEEEFSFRRFEASFNDNLREGIAEIKELQVYLSKLDLIAKTELNLYLTEGLSINTDMMYEVSLVDQNIASGMSET
ncbi:MAG: hypothetical protein ACOYVK_04895 [Bacillota bacterium]